MNKKEKKEKMKIFIKSPKYVVIDRNKQSEVIFKSKSLETVKKVVDILNKYFNDEYEGDRFFISSTRLSSVYEEILFEQIVKISYEIYGKVKNIK